MAVPAPVITLSVGGPITFKTRALTVATIETTKAHNLAVGDLVSIVNEDATFNGTGLAVVSVPTALSFTYGITTGTNARTAGAGTGSVQPTTIALQINRPSLAIDAVESGANGTVLAGGRVWRNVAVDSLVRDTPAVVNVRRAGTILANCNVTNTDPLTAASANTTLTVTDAIAASATTNLGTGTYIPMPLLPIEWRDPIIATPGLPTAAEMGAARQYGTVLPIVSQRLALSA